MERMTVDRLSTCPPTAAVSATAAISADNHNYNLKPLSREPPKLIGMASPATHGFRTSTKQFKNRRAMELCQSDFAAQSIGQETPHGATETN
jgi:hypothetical protein